MKDIENLSKWYISVQLDFDKTLQKLRYKTIRNFFKGDTCLEIAPAQGITTNSLKDDFKILHLVEGSENLLNEIPDYPNVVKFHSMIEDFNPPMQYDFVLMDHILEHIENPVQVLEKVKTFLKQGSLLMIGVPNARSFHRLAAVKMGYLKSIYELNERDADVGHYRVYDFDSLIADAEEAGLTVLDKKGVFFKPLSNKQINDTWTPEMIEGFYLLGDDFQDNAGEIYITCSL